MEGGRRLEGFPGWCKVQKWLICPYSFPEGIQGGGEGAGSGARFLSWRQSEQAGTVKWNRLRTGKPTMDIDTGMK